MATTAKWLAPETIATALSTELNSITNGSATAASPAIDNETDLFQYIELELVLASLNPTGTPSVDIYLLKSVDGTNYEDSSTSNGGSFFCSFTMATGSAAKRCCLANLVIPPCKFKFVAVNNTGVTTGASGSTLKYRRYFEQAT